jgi:tRNA U38,U39,U40 pseudouridine synthase TruA
MDFEVIEKFCKQKGLEIARILLGEHDSADFETSGREIEREIYEVSTSYSRILFFEARQFLHESVRSEVKSHLSSRFESKDVQKMKDVDLIAHWIKSEVIEALEDKGLFL